jgi:serine/threonine protein kinase
MGGNDIWKISDFGISKIKTVPHGQPDLESEHLLDKVFKPEKNMDPSSGVKTTRFGGTYAAPEAREETNMVTRKSDMWSLGCVLALVLTFLES